jgi:hypothetical protein
LKQEREPHHRRGVSGWKLSGPLKNQEESPVQISPILKRNASKNNIRNQLIGNNFEAVASKGSIT